MFVEKFTRRQLPHWYVPGAMHFVTYRLAGSIPQSAICQWREEREQAIAVAKRRPDKRDELIAIAHKQFFAKYDQFLDANQDMQTLADPRMAAMIRENLHYHRGTKYHLLAYCVMPNHVHVLLQPTEISMPAGIEFVSDETHDAHSPLANVMHSLKSYTSHRAGELLGSSGSFWQTESYDHWVRDEDELERIILYIHHNPVKAGLVAWPRDWCFSSAHDRFLQDGFENGALLERPV